MIYDGKYLREKYIFDSAGQPYVTFDTDYLHYLEDYGADEYDILTASVHVDNCGRVICYPQKNWHGYFEPIDNEYLLDELYDLASELNQE